jgi:hypothetical protein
MTRDEDDVNEDGEEDILHRLPTQKDQQPANLARAEAMSRLFADRPAALKMNDSREKDRGGSHH